MIRALFEQIATPARLGPLVTGGSPRLGRIRPEPRGRRRVFTAFDEGQHRSVFL
jgi:hypothetical protein